MQLTTEKTRSFLDQYYVHIAITMVVVIIIGGFFVLLWPQYQSLQQSGVLEYQEAVNTLETRQKYLGQLEAMEKNFTNTDTRVLRTIEKVLPSYRPSVATFQEIELFLEQEGFVVTAINVATKADTPSTPADVYAVDVADKEPASEFGDEVQALSITVGIESASFTYAGFKNFLTTLEEYEHLLELSSISFGTETNGANLVFTTYQQAPSKEELDAIQSIEIE